MDACAQPFLDHRSVDLDAADRVTYRIEQSFHYAYASPITALTQRLVVVPRRRHGDAHRRAHAVDVRGAVARRQTRQDAKGNTVVRVTAPHVQSAVEFRVTAVVELLRGSGAVLDESTLHDPRLRQPTRLTAPDDRLRAMAADAVRPGGGVLDVAERICTAVHEAITYEYGVTNIETTAAEALAGGKGVCQDAAHVMVALCHLAELPVRYVSGHLLGQGGTHAWAEVLVPAFHGATAVAFDPCNNRRTDRRYVTVAVGRDYADVAPASGTFTGDTGGQLTTSRDVGVVAVS